jgi:hypothetical protein
MSADLAAAAPFGRRALSARDADELLALERSYALDERFADIDALVGMLITRILRGERIVSVARGDRTPDSVQVLRVEGAKAVLEDRLAVYAQQRRGAWFLPEEATLRAGLPNLPHHMMEQPRFAHGAAADETAKVRLGDSPDTLLVWALLEPLCEQLLSPFELRARYAGKKDRDEAVAAWTVAERFLRGLGFEVGAQLEVLSYGHGWARLRADEQIGARADLLRAMDEQCRIEMGSRYRTEAIRILLERYYAKAKKGPPLRRQALSPKPLERTLSGFFGGDWLSFLDYAGEEPHPDERIATSLPEARLFVGGSARVAEVAAAQGLPVAAVEQMLASFWGGGEVASPVDRRVEAMRRYWTTFDEIHARQRSGMDPLWGLNQEDGLAALGVPGPTPYRPAEISRQLPTEVLASIRQLWSGRMLPAWPERIVSEPLPVRAMAVALGPALTLWHGAALTAWFVAEGPMSRTDLAGLAEYQRLERAALEALGCPADPAMYAELEDAERRLGPPRPIEDKREMAAAGGISFSISYSTGSRRHGFDKLREIVTRHRRAWTAQYLESYLKSRWEQELREANRDYHQTFEQRGRPPTAKQFARVAAPATNNWFDGDISGLYGAIGEKCPIKPVRIRLLPADPVEFVRSVFVALGGDFGKQSELQKRRFEPSFRPRDNEALRIEEQRDSGLRRLAESSLRAVQLAEALGRAPDLKDFGASTFTPWADAVGPDAETAWRRYWDAVARILEP